MSLGFLVPMYHDELFGGYLMRLFKASPYIYPRNFSKEVFANNKERINYLHINNLRPDFVKQLDEQFGFQNIIRNHTLIGFNNLFGKYTGISKSSRYLRYCPLCEPYFRVLPQIEGLTHCYKHQCHYVDSTVSLDRNISYLIKPFQFMATNNIEIADSSFIAIKLGKYIKDILNVPIITQKQLKIGHLLRSYIPQKYFRSSSRGQIYIKRLQNDIDVYYKDLEGYDLTVRRTQRILNGEAFGSFHICLLGLFLGITPENLVSRVPKRRKDIQKQIIEMNKQGFSERYIAKKLDISKTNVHKSLIKLGGKNNDEKQNLQ